MLPLIRRRSLALLHLLTLSLAMAWASSAQAIVVQVHTTGANENPVGSLQFSAGGLTVQLSGTGVEVNTEGVAPELGATTNFDMNEVLDVALVAQPAGGPFQVTALEFVVDLDSPPATGQFTLNWGMGSSAVVDLSGGSMGVVIIVVAVVGPALSVGGLDEFSIEATSAIGQPTRLHGIHFAPEPATVGLLMLGLVALGGRRHVCPKLRTISG